MNTSGFSKVKGFTLLELMVVMAIIGIFASLALPSYRASIRDSAREEAAIALANALAIARSEAVTRGRQVSVTPNLAADTPPGNGRYDGGVWSVVLQDGSAAFAGDPSPVIETFQVSEVDSVSTPAIPNLSAPFVFSTDGTLGQTSLVSFCYSDAAFCSQVRVNLVGRAQIAQVVNTP